MSSTAPPEPRPSLAPMEAFVQGQPGFVEALIAAGPPRNYNKLERQRLARICMKLLKHWGLTREDQAMVLDANRDNRELLRGFERGDKALPNSADTLRRAELLIEIGNTLGALYPENPEVIARWITCRDAALENLTPLVVVERLGLEGLIRLRDRLRHEALG